PSPATSRPTPMTSLRRTRRSADCSRRSSCGRSKGCTASRSRSGTSSSRRTSPPSPARPPTCSCRSPGPMRSCSPRARSAWCRCRSASGRKALQMPGVAPTRRHDEPLPMRGARRFRRRVLVLAAAARVVPGQALARAARQVRPRRDRAARPRRRARRRPVGGVGAGPRPRLRGERAAPSGGSAPNRRGRRAAHARRRAPPALGPGPRAGRPRRPDDSGARGGGRGRPGAHLGGAFVPHARGAPAAMNELALAAFAAHTDSHLVHAPRGERFARFARSFDSNAYLADLERRGLRWVARSSPHFPRALGAIFDAPAGLFLRGLGELELLERPAVAIVGARSCSTYGSDVARMLGRELAAAGLVVVSGLARGVDGQAHRGALEAGGITVAVLGCGVDRDYPAAHAELAARIGEHGLVVSEYAPGVQPAPWRFPARNRIIAGLSQATVVVEARERSGALITADLALEEGREVF